MGFLSNIKRLYKNLRDGLHWAHVACRAAEKINAEIQASNATDEIKAQAADFLEVATALCDAIAAYISALNNPEE